MLKVYNSLTRRKEDFIPLNAPYVNMYSCGITASGHAHIGHGIQALIFDTIRLYLEKIGFKVTYARNYTDVDDKIIINANKENVNPIVFAEKLMAETDMLMAKLGVNPPSMCLRASKHIDKIIEFIEILIKKGYAYPTDKGDVYYKVDEFKSYGKLSNRDIKDALNGVRIDNEENKNSPLDFALWKSAKEGEIFWESPWGKGRPGWHIECSCMNYYNLGEQIDIHGGGRDLIFPHHENEIAQTEAVTGKQFAKYWIHNGLIKVDGQKMSKSLGNSIFLEDLLNEYDKEVIRFSLFQTNYRKDINITKDLFKDSQEHLLDFYKIMLQVEELPVTDNGLNQKIDDEFNEAMNDDFNTAKAIANLFKTFKEMKIKLNNNDMSVKRDYNQIKETFKILGLFQTNCADFIYKNDVKNDAVPQEIMKKAEERWQAKKERNFAVADALRKELSDLGYEILDSKDGYTVQKKGN